MKVQVFCDGASRGNPGEAGIGVVIKSAEGKVLKEISAYAGRATNNIAEYLAFIRGLEEALLLGSSEASFFSDSELLVNQVKGSYKVKNEGLQPLFLHAKQLIGKFKKFELEHKYREQNEHADELANRGIDEHSSNLKLFPD